MDIHGIPAYICQDNGAAVAAKRLRNWLVRIGTKTAYITPVSPS
jgi:hypothetical protein